MTQPRPYLRFPVCLVGISGYARVYVDLLKSAAFRERIDWTSVVVVPAEKEQARARALEESGVRVYASFDAMLAAEGEEMRLCVIPTGIQWHARMTCDALRAGAHVLVEKPLAGCLADAEAVRACERETGRWVALGYQDLYAEALAWMKEQLLAGAIGRLQSVRVIGLWPRSEAYYARNHWAGRLQVDGAVAHDSPLNNAFAHFVNLALFLAGPAPRRSAEATVTGAELYRAHCIESFDTAVVTAQSPGGTDFWFGVSHACAGYREPEIHLTGEAGTAGWRHGQDCHLAPRGGPETRRPVSGPEESRRGMMDAVLRRLEKPDEPVCGTDIAIEHTRLIDALHRDHAIHTVDGDTIDWCDVKGHAHPIPSIRGLEAFFDRALRAGCSLRAAGFRPALASSA